MTVRWWGRLGKLVASDNGAQTGQVPVWNDSTKEWDLGTPGGTSGPHATTHQNNGTDEISVAGLSGLLADPQTPATHDHASEISAAITAHEGLADPHPTYTTDAEVSAAISAHAGAADPHPTYTTAAEAASVAASAVATHEAASDPHTGYQKESEKGQANGYANLDGAATVPVAQIPALSYLATSAFSGLAKISVGTSAPVGPGTGDLWVDTN